MAPRNRRATLDVIDDLEIGLSGVRGKVKRGDVVLVGEIDRLRMLLVELRSGLERDPTGEYRRLDDDDGDRDE